MSKNSLEILEIHLLTTLLIELRRNAYIHAFFNELTSLFFTTFHNYIQTF